MCYTMMLSDGNSVAHKAVKDAKCYDLPIDKLECMNHCHKRMGAALTKKLDLVGKKSGTLMDKKCKQLRVGWVWGHCKAISDKLGNVCMMPFGLIFGIP